MDNLDLEGFISLYFSVALGILQKENPVKLDIFYDRTFERISGKTGLSIEEIGWVHHPFHWTLFLQKNPSLEIFQFPKKEEKTGYYVRSKNGLPEESELSDYFMKNYRQLLESKLKKIGHFGQEFKGLNISAE